MVECIILLIGESCEWVAVRESAVRIEQDEAETSAIAVAERLDIVLRPVAAADVKFNSHIVDILLDVNELLYLLVARLVRSTFRQLHQLIPSFLGASLLHIAAVGRHLPLIHVVGVKTIDRKAVCLVVRLAQVQHTDIFTVDELMNRVPALCLQIEAAAAHHLLNGSVLDASAAVVVTSVAQFQ